MLTIKHLTLAYGDKRVIQDLNFDLTKGSFTVILGENGVGKTTLIRALLGQLKPQTGTIEFENEQQTVKLGYVPQFRNVDEEYPLTIREFVALNLYHGLTPWLKRQERGRVDWAIKQTNLTQIENRPLGQASGGEKQRAYLAQALIERPNLLILDESTASLDVGMKYELLELVRRLQAEQTLSVLFVTHDLPLAKQFADHFLLMEHDHYQTGKIEDLKITKAGEGHV
ncbi:metal ABC transporter ATP-binding protein [Paucilactobacillus kaifaensis]|uniref:metal ABC transporter ATP-binding protein n=1 Tax=Paucilactobacillus kaifaensis TaxID=2559921 RepID=UPI0027D98E6B|nr:ATP-binding cassette domain-containing protein [Paucilactobacillus kaifaensis]